MYRPPSASVSSFFPKEASLMLWSTSNPFLYSEQSVFFPLCGAYHILQFHTFVYNFFLTSSALDWKLCESRDCLQLFRLYLQHPALRLPPSRGLNYMLMNGSLNMENEANIILQGFFKLFYWSIIYLQCCVNFCCTAKWFSWIYVCTWV